jgi:hypothetical protein
LRFAEIGHDELLADEGLSASWSSRCWNLLEYTEASQSPALRACDRRRLHGLKRCQCKSDPGPPSPLQSFYAPLLALQGASDSPRLFQDRFINPTEWFRGEASHAVAGITRHMVARNSRTHQRASQSRGGTSRMGVSVLFAADRMATRRRGSSAACWRSIAAKRRVSRLGRQSARRAFSFPTAERQADLERLAVGPTACCWVTWRPLVVSRSSSEGRRPAAETAVGCGAGATVELPPVAHSVSQPPPMRTTAEPK